MHFLINIIVGFLMTAGLVASIPAGIAEGSTVVAREAGYMPYVNYSEQYEQLQAHNGNATIEARYPLSPLCDAQGWPRAKLSDIYKIKKSLPGGQACIAKARECKVIGWSSGFIFTDGAAKMILCNDNDFTIHPTCSYLAWYVDEIARVCNRNGWASGQFFDTDKYNVIVRL